MVVMMVIVMVVMVMMMVVMMSPFNFLVSFVKRKRLQTFSCYVDFGSEG